ncbi:hypothetical protein EJ05DRAFT_375950 [Pseudovirgaria hyperparasitica]|uniref:Protein EFR3 n=1 Tax=Pseudovirgaria hyperparasitica TaxID=470096 RepID=A0A6A6W778_9PEZI|nr:uncharacterized protein EJ05DRAFT_375950 [Pseudovirgaria hyperparasitica]KAF2758059.1 hypothetical protein EJ05DRAFT_375950 [Pseudovirgaria hyperparasitica]
MQGVRRRLRPKHQALIIDCYPRLQKNSVEAKPNSSELSYLLYYASTRRSKLTKVTEFLDRKTVSDVYKGRIGNVQVTLEILQALIEKCPRDLPLYRSAILNSIRTILQSNDVNMVEDSVPTWEALCAHQDPITLAADQDYIAQYEEIVKMYADFASKETTSAGKSSISWPVAIRFRKAGLEAIKAVAASEALGSETSRQLTVIIPAILLNMYSHNGKDLEELQEREEEKEVQEKEQGLRRRQSISTVQTAGTDEADPVAASGTTAEADKLAEIEVGIVALQALRNVFTVVNRGQLRLATSTVLTFVANRSRTHETLTHHEHRPSQISSWPNALFAMICGWTPVQDRFVVLVSAVESLVRSPIVEEDLQKQLIFASMIQSLLSSNISFIGLSIMDVLIGFIQHVLLLLQLGGQSTALRPHHQQSDAINPVRESKDAMKEKSEGNSDPVIEIAVEPSFTRQLLLSTLQTSIGMLATHVYYADQISDMITTILSRLKPSNLESSVATTDSSSSEPRTSSFFSFDNARLIALAAIREILIVANSKIGGRGAGRGSVGVDVWNGTQWLLRDPSLQVRQAYIEALLTWLEKETDKSSLRVTRGRGIPQQGGSVERAQSLVRRAVSNASHRERSPRPAKNSTFLPLLHLAIYENAHQHVTSEPDILMLHLLLTSLVQNLGLNALRYGLPMIMRLQDDIKTTQDMKSKVHLGSLVHGYLWGLSVHFDFQNSQIGNNISREIARRNQSSLWGNGVRVPPSSLDSIRSNSRASNGQGAYASSGDLRLFDDRDGLVDIIIQGYSGTLISPPTSPPGSPGRSFSTPILAAPTSRSSADDLPTDIKDQLLAPWTKEATIAATAKDSDSSASVSGSKGARSSGKNLLAVNIPGGNISDIEVHSSTKRSARRRSAGANTASIRNRQDRGDKENRSTATSTTTDTHAATTVTDLKRALSGSTRVSFPVHGLARSQLDPTDDDTSESMVSADFSASEVSFVTAGQPSELDLTPKATPLPNAGGNTSGITVEQNIQEYMRERERDSVPPVPPLPANLRAAASPVRSRPGTAPGSEAIGNSNGSGEGVVSRGNAGGEKARSLRQGSVKGSVKGSMRVAKTRTRESTMTGPRPDFSGLLEAIDVGDDGDEAAVGERAVPPY